MLRWINRKSNILGFLFLFVFIRAMQLSAIGIKMMLNVFADDKFNLDCAINVLFRPEKL